MRVKLSSLHPNSHHLLYDCKTKLPRDAPRIRGDRVEGFTPSTFKKRLYVSEEQVIVNVEKLGEATRRCCPFTRHVSWYPGRLDETQGNVSMPTFLYYLHPLFFLYLAGLHQEGPPLWSRSYSRFLPLIVEFFLATVWLKDSFFLPAIFPWLGFNIIALVNDIYSRVMIWVSVKLLDTICIIIDYTNKIELDWAELNELLLLFVEYDAVS